MFEKYVYKFYFLNFRIRLLWIITSKTLIQIKFYEKKPVIIIVKLFRVTRNTRPI